MEQPLEGELMRNFPVSEFPLLEGRNKVCWGKLLSDSNTSELSSSFFNDCQSSLEIYLLLIPLPWGHLWAHCGAGMLDI